MSFSGKLLVQSRTLQVILQLLVVVVSSATAAVAATNAEEWPKLPSFIKVCHRNDPLLNVCVRDAIQALKDRIPRGIPELFLPPLEPLVVPEMRMDQDSGAIYMHSSYKNIHIHGLSNYALGDVVIDPAKHELWMAVKFPNLSLNADYKMKGKIMMMPLLGEGDCRANFTNVDVEIAMVLARHKQASGRVHLRIKDLQIKYEIEKTHLRLENLFNGDEALGERMNTFLNENWQSLSDEVRPFLEKTVAEVVRKATDKLFKAYSYDDLLPE